MVEEDRSSNSEQVMKRGGESASRSKQRPPCPGISSVPLNAQRAPTIPRQLLSSADRLM